MNQQIPPDAKGRGSQINPRNRFSRLQVEADLEHLEFDEEAQHALRHVPTEYFVDHAKSVISENQSPDLPFRYSLNLYRGCAHGCSYCFARPTHEYLDLGAGLDFESKIFVKEDAPELFREFLSRESWTPQPISLSGITDCYQPIERKLTLTRRCLEVAWEARQPMALVTKNALVTRDIDILQSMAKLNLVTVAVSVTTLDQELIRVMEPRTSSSEARLRAIQELSSAGIPVHALLAPIIPGLTDYEIPSILKAVKSAGAISASYILLRLPLTVKPVFLEWLARSQPLKKEKIESLIRETRGGNLYEAEFGVRMKGRGEIAEQIGKTFELFARKYELDKQRQPLDTRHFKRPQSRNGQRLLFD